MTAGTAAGNEVDQLGELGLQCQDRDDADQVFRVDVFTVFEGHVTNEELLGHDQRLAADPDFRPTMNHVLDTRGVTSVSVTALGVRLVAAPSMFAPGARRAIVSSETNRPAGSGYVSMFQTLRSQSGEDIKIFSAVEDAHRWLGLE